MIRLTGVREMEAKLMAVADSREVRSAMAAAGAKVLASMATDAIRDAKLRPAPWPPLAASTKKGIGAAAAKTRKRKAAKAKAAEKAVAGHVLLYRTGALSQSLRPVASGDTFGVASDRPYAVFHQFGTSKMPARPFVPALGKPGAEKLTPAAEKAVAEAAQAAFDAALRRITG